MKIQVKLIKKTSWSGFNLLPKCKDTVVARQDRSGYITGLTKEEEEKLETDLFLTKGTLSRFSEYWLDYAVFLTEKGLQLDTENPKDLIDYKLLLMSEKVANSVNELTDFPKARFVIYDMLEDAKKENEFNKIKKKAFGEFNKLSVPDMKKLLKLFGINSDNGTDEIVENTLMEIVETRPSEFLKMSNIEDFSIRLLIEELLQNNILRKVGPRYEYGQDTIGHTIDKAIEYLKDPLNQELVIVLKENLDARKKTRK